ncbi:MAG: sulfite exporter TauE/SafE family protein [Planctomycetota bacterium]
MDFMTEWYWLPPFGFMVGIIASMVGVGGGVFMVPFLLLVFDPHRFDPAHATATSLCIIILTSLSSTSVNAVKKRIDYGAAVPFALATLPGAILGPYLLKGVPTGTFKVAFGVLLVLTAINMAFIQLKKPALPRQWGVPRRLVEKNGTAHDYRIHYPLGILASLAAGFVASMAGVGGGIIHMPILILLFGMTPYVSSATSQFMLFITALAATIVNAYLGNVYFVVALLMGSGVVFGAQVGTRWAGMVRRGFLRKILAVVMILVAAKLFLQVTGIMPAPPKRLDLPSDSRVDCPPHEDRSAQVEDPPGADHRRRP